MQQPELFEDEPTRERMQREFVGTTSVTASFDPNEFRGMTVPQITDEVKAVLRSIKPDVDFYEQDIVLAASDLASR